MTTYDRSADSRRPMPAARSIQLGAAIAATLSMAPVGQQPLAEESSAVLEQITVTARRREESLQTAPVSVTALSGDALAAMNTQNSTDLDNAIPNVMLEVASINNSGGTAAVFIRGIGQSDFTLNTDPGVGVFVDGVYLARSVGAVLDLLDLERVEVLRGPQGTLFGRNTIGGAINFVTQRPAETFGGYATVTAGDRERIDFKGSVDLPLNDRLLTKSRSCRTTATATSA